MAIAVKGAGVRNVERRRTRHGPVLPGFFRNLEGLLAPGHVAALQWTALSDDDTTVATGMVDAERAHASATTWSACAPTSCRCRAWWSPTRAARSA